MMIRLLFLIVLPCSLLFSQEKLVNTAHLDHLYEEIIVDTDTLGIIHIYSEFPGYEWVDDEDEGTACVDDAARALVFYLNNYITEQDSASLIKTRRLINFLLFMQSENGFFYNFIWKDKTINKEFQTSVAEPDWWSWRALWALAEALSYFQKTNPPLAIQINTHITKLLSAALPVLEQDEKYVNYGGIRLPGWLPYETAADQAAVILKGLALYYAATKDSSVLNLIAKLSDGIIKMQAGSKDSPPYFAFLSWQNTWHAWGNSQADALLTAGQILNDTVMINSALNEIKYFYPVLIWKNYFSSFNVKQTENETAFSETFAYPQIAYGFRPMIFAALSAYEYTKDSFYADLAGTIASWFFGRNRADTVMYFTNTGICYDGFTESDVNRNSGAESTIEALLSMQKIESTPSAKEILFEELGITEDEKK